MPQPPSYKPAYYYCPVSANYKVRGQTSENTPTLLSEK
jgi:hypothetical protein